MILTYTQLQTIFGETIYSGKSIHSRFAYRVYRDKVGSLGNIILFRAPMVVEAAGMVDSEDLIENDFIYSDDAINICWEIPNLDPFGAVCFQRLFNTHIANILSSKYIKAPIEVDGDDLIVHNEHNQGGVVQPKGKCSVSITFSKNNVALGHTGINIIAGKRAPAFAYSTNLNAKDVDSFMGDVEDMFYSLVEDIFKATTKVIC